MLKSKIDAARKLSSADWRLLVRAWLLLLYVDIALRVLPFPRLGSWSTKSLPSSDPLSPSEIDASIRQIYRTVLLASRNHLYAMTCLRRSLVTQRLLSRRGIATKLRFGVEKVEGQMQAHAWLEYEGKPIGEPETLSERYAMLVSRVKPS
jgi:hypothetical protein